ncbi:MAG: hypothetical protein QW343_01100 [Candidatus Norongarragalinales archaeon]
MVSGILAARGAASARSRNEALRILSRDHGVSTVVLTEAYENGWSLNAARAAEILASATFPGKRLTPKLIRRAVGVLDTTEVHPQPGWAVQPKKFEAALIPRTHEDAVRLANAKANYLARDSAAAARREPHSAHSEVEARRLRFWREAQDLLGYGPENDLSKGVLELMMLRRAGVKSNAPAVTRDSLNPRLLRKVRSLKPRLPPKRPPKRTGHSGDAYAFRGAAQPRRPLARSALRMR